MTQRLADALAGERVGGGGGVADEQHPAAAVRVDLGRRGRGWARPGAVLGSGVGPEHGGDVRAARGARGHSAFMSADGDRGRPRWMPKPTLTRAVGQRERPGVAGQEVGLEPHPQRSRARGPDAAEVLAEGVPLAQVAAARRRRGSLRIGDHMPSAAMT